MGYTLAINTSENLSESLILDFDKAFEAIKTGKIKLPNQVETGFTVFNPPPSNPPEDIITVGCDFGPDESYAIQSIAFEYQQIPLTS